VASSLGEYEDESGGGNNSVKLRKEAGREIGTTTKKGVGNRRDAREEKMLNDE